MIKNVVMGVLVFMLIGSVLMGHNVQSNLRAQNERQQEEIEKMQVRITHFEERPYEEVEQVGEALIQTLINYTHGEGRERNEQLKDILTKKAYEDIVLGSQQEDITLEESNEMNGDASWTPISEQTGHTESMYQTKVRNIRIFSDRVRETQAQAVVLFDQETNVAGERSTYEMSLYIEMVIEEEEWKIDDFEQLGAKSKEQGR
jgi:hypothetical protein